MLVKLYCIFIACCFVSLYSCEWNSSTDLSLFCVDPSSILCHSNTIAEKTTKKLQQKIGYMQKRIYVALGLKHAILNNARITDTAKTLIKQLPALIDNYLKLVNQYDSIVTESFIRNKFLDRHIRKYFAIDKQNCMRHRSNILQWWDALQDCELTVHKLRNTNKIRTTGYKV